MSEVELNQIISSTLTVGVSEINHEFQSAFLKFLIFSVVCAMLFYIIRVTVKTRRKKITSFKTTKDIPCVQHFPCWVPSFIELFYRVYLLRKEDIRIGLDWWASINYSPIWTMKNPLEIVFITDPNLIKQIFGSPLIQFHHKPKFFYDVLLSELLKDGLVASHPNIWKPHRKIYNQYFTHRTLPSHLKTIHRYGNLLTQKLDTFPEAGIKMDDFSPILYDTILSVILDVLLGEKILDEMGTREMQNKFQEWKALVTYRFINIQNMIPLIWKFNPKRRTYVDTISYLNNYNKEAISKSRMTLEEKQVYGDDELENLTCVEHMLLNGFSEKEIMDEMATLIFAGHDTTDTTFHFLFQNLAEHPQIQRKCQDEIDSLFNSKDNQLYVTMDDLTQLKYLEQCILETIRLAPALPIIGRQLDQESVVGEYVLEKGALISFPIWLLHRHPEIYPEPEKFDPDRFLPENAKARHPYAFIPFSMGPRNCIGRKIAMMELKCFMALILRNYNISSSDKMENVRLYFNVTLLPERKFNLLFQKRKF